MPRLSASSPLGTGRGESWEDGRHDIRRSEAEPSEAAKRKSGASICRQDPESIALTWMHCKITTSASD